MALVKSLMEPVSYLPGDPHSRSASVSSNSSGPNNSRPPSAHSQGLLSVSLGTSHPSDLPGAGEDLYHRSPFGAPGLPSASGTLPPSTQHTTHTRHSSSSSTSYSLASTGVTSPADSPPEGSHGAAGHCGSNGLNAAMKNQLAIRNAHMRHVARAAASPYPRDAHSHSGSEAEQDELALYLANPGTDYSGMYMAPQMAHHIPHPQDPSAAAASFGRMSLGTDLTLEHLANNVRAATTTSASDRAKQIFVQAWYAYISSHLPPPAD